MLFFNHDWLKTDIFQDILCPEHKKMIIFCYKQGNRWAFAPQKNKRTWYEKCFFFQRHPWFYSMVKIP